MIAKLSAAAGLALAFAVLIPACASQPPKQAEAPDVLSDKGSDMSGGEDARNGAVLKDADQSGVEKMHEKCCAQCKDGMAKDRTGAAASTIPCTDFTDALDPFCLEHFRGKKTMASECP
jgi:hypothetical protein